MFERVTWMLFESSSSVTRASWVFKYFYLFIELVPSLLSSLVWREHRGSMRAHVTVLKEKTKIEMGGEVEIIKKEAEEDP